LLGHTFSSASLELGDWFIDEELSYLRIYGCEGSPYILPRYVPNKLALREIAYQTISVGIVIFFVKKHGPIVKKN